MELRPFASSVASDCHFHSRVYFFAWFIHFDIVHCSAGVGWKGQPMSGTGQHHCSAGVGQSKLCSTEYECPALVTTSDLIWTVLDTLKLHFISHTVLILSLRKFCVCARVRTI